MSIIQNSLKQTALSQGWFRLRFLWQDESGIHPISVLFQPKLGQVDWLGQRFLLPDLNPDHNPNPDPHPEILRQSQSKIRAVMAGTVAEIAVKGGDLVAEGDLLCILEAMKMRLEVTAPKSAKVQRLAVNVAETVHLGQLLLQLETLCTDEF
jgi:hypothetical protein